MRARTCQGLSTGAVTKSLYSGNWQASQFGHELTLANGCFVVAAQGSRSRRPATGPACVAVSGRRLWRDSRLGGERDGHGVEQLARSHHRVSRRTEFLKVRRLHVCLVCSRVAVDLKHAHEARFPVPRRRRARGSPLRGAQMPGRPHASPRRKPRPGQDQLAARRRAGTD